MKSTHIQRECDSCKVIDDEYWMHEIYVSHEKRMWLCTKCYQRLQTVEAYGQRYKAVIRGLKERGKL